jgi:hypothetical protein
MCAIDCMPSSQTSFVTPPVRRRIKGWQMDEMRNDAAVGFCLGFDDM